MEECGHEIRNEFHWSQKSRGAQAIIIATQDGTSNVAVTYKRSVSAAESFIDFIQRPGAGYPQSEGSGAKFEVSLGRATAVRALRAELEVMRTQPFSPCHCGVPCRSLEVGS